MRTIPLIGLIMLGLAGQPWLDSCPARTVRRNVGGGYGSVRHTPAVSTRAAAPVRAQPVRTPATTRSVHQGPRGGTVAQVRTPARGATAVKGPHGGTAVHGYGPHGSVRRTSSGRRYVRTFPYGSSVTVIRIGRVPYYYWGGVYYRSYYYGGEVVYVEEAPPADAEYDGVPPDADAIEVNGTNYYYAANAYFLRDVRADGAVSYSITPPPVGAVVDQVPADSNLVVVKRTSYFLSGETYYLPTNKDGKVVYTVVGNPLAQ